MNKNKIIQQSFPIGLGFDKISDHVIITDKNGVILYANKAVERNTGFSAEEITGRKPGDLWGGKMGMGFYRKMWHTIKIDKKPFVGEVQNVRKDGTLYWQELRISPILNNKGDVQFFIGIEPNITAKKEEEKFRNEFISIISHQFRNPLQTIGLITELLYESKTITSEDKKSLRVIASEDRRLSDFIRDLLALSRIGSSQLTQESFNLGHEIKKSIIEARVHNPNVKISFAKKGKNFYLTANKSLTTQIFFNLIYNAIEYSDGKVNISLEKNNSNYLFSCYNNGLGISAEDKPKIFSKFFRSDSALKIKKNGNGLGLYIVKSIADEFGWDIWFDSKAGKGTTFYVKIKPT